MRALADNLADNETAELEITEELGVAELNMGAEVPLSAFTLNVVNGIEQLGPFGQSNSRPLLCTSGVSLAEPPRQIGSGGHHLDCARATGTRESSQWWRRSGFRFSS